MSTRSKGDSVTYSVLCVVARWAVLGLLVAAGASCSPKYPTCDRDNDCRAAEYCVNGRCQQCRTDLTCGAGRVCKAGRCEAKPECTSTTDCDIGKVCVKGSCTSCTADEQCGAGGRCRGGQCVAKGSCTRDDDCQADEDCVEGKCAKAMTTSTPPVSSGACTFDAIFFEFDDSSLSAEARAIVDRNAECLRKTAGGSVMVEGHADRRGTEEYNLALSERRARSVEERLRVLGLERGRLQVVGKGKLEASGANDSGYAKDRRVELKWR